MRNSLERRVLVLAPLGRDATLIQTMLRHDSVPCVACADLTELNFELARGAAAIVATEEALGDPLASVAPLLANQPPWSDLPVLVLTRTGASSATAEQAVGALGNVTLLERPVRVAALTSAVRSAVRARERQYQIRSYLSERDRLDRRKDEFLATLAHELRNPLAPIRSSLDLLRLQADSAALPEVLATMDRQVTHMMRLVDDLMDVSRVTRGKIHLRRAPARLGEILDAAIEIARPQLEAAGHRLSVAPAPAEAWVDGDAVRLTQVFANLLNNAVKYTNAGGRIEVRATAGPQWLQVEITDNGIGIRPEALPHLFEMFFQAANDARMHIGLGIGLTLARTLVEMHGGTIHASSPGIGKGSTFTVRLPAAASVSASAPSADAARPSQPLASPQSRSQPRVMIVDDNRDAADSLALLLRTLGAEVKVANDGVSALSALDAFNPAALFLDIGMPGMDGYQLAGLVRERSGPALPVLVALTGWGQDRDRARSQAAGFAHHLVKPADAGKLRAVLASLAG